LSKGKSSFKGQHFKHPTPKKQTLLLFLLFSFTSSSSWVTFVAVQNGIGLQSSAIFFSWNDAKPFVTVGSGSGIIGDDEEGKETDGTTNCIDVNSNVNYQTFSTIDEAVQYLTGKHDNNYISDSNGKKRKTSSITFPTIK
jgi:hypothetical protein